MGYDAFSDRIVRLKLAAHPHPINLIQVYAPTSKSSDDEITNFYADIATLYQAIPSKEITVLMGDLNAKVGDTAMDDHLKEVVGRFGLGQIGRAHV